MYVATATIRDSWYCHETIQSHVAMAANGGGAARLHPTMQLRIMAAVHVEDEGWCLAPSNRRSSNVARHFCDVLAPWLLQLPYHGKSQFNNGCYWYIPIDCNVGDQGRNGNRNKRKYHLRGSQSILDAVICMLMMNDVDVDTVNTIGWLVPREKPHLKRWYRRCDRCYCDCCRH
jgi:hypothetical protein